MFHLFDALADRFPALQALLLPELRVLLAAACAFGLALAIGPRLIRGPAECVKRLPQEAKDSKPVNPRGAG